MAINPDDSARGGAHGTSRVEAVAGGKEKKKTNWLAWIALALGILALLWWLSRQGDDADPAATTTTTEQTTTTGTGDATP